MSSALEPSTSPTDTRPSDERKQSPPAFLDLADSAARLGTNMPDISARVELKRMEHERQRALQRKMFEDQMRALEQQQAQELLSIPVDSNGNAMQHLAVSAPTTPPRVNSALGGEVSPSRLMMDPTLLSNAVGKADKRKSVTYAPMTASMEFEHGSNEAGGNMQPSFARPVGAKSMPASRRTSASSHDEELANHLQNMSMGERTASPAMMGTPQVIERPKGQNVKFRNGNGNGYNAGILLDEQLDKEMQNAMRHFPISDDDRFGVSRGDAFVNKQLSTSSAALDLAPLSQTPPRAAYVHRPLEARDKTSDWSQLSSGGPKGYEELARREVKRTVTTPQLGMHTSLTDLSSGKLGTVSASATPHIGQHTPGVSRRSSPLGIPTSNLRPDVAQLVKTPGTPQSVVESHGLGSRLVQSHHLNESAVSASDLSASLSRISSGQYEGSPLNFDSPRTMDEPLQNQYDVDSIYLNNQNVDGNRFNGFGFEANSRINPTGASGGSTALYHHHGSRYGLGMGARINGPDTKMNGLHGPKHKRGDMDREFNRFAGTRLEDLQGEIASLCKDQHGCRYLQKKLEEGVPEHRDMIFRETFGHFAELMTDPFGNYLCQKLLEYSTDEQRNVICESVAQDLVNISLNMHGTRAVQKMIDFLSTQRQADLRYNAQIHSIIVALSLHVVVLIKDLNGNHVIQKCLNKLAPEDNQFIYNAVAANCVEVATHRHGCCVLQRCIDHASDHQRVQLVNEITYNALTLVQDPYGNYVVQYILDLNDNRFSDAVIRQFTGNVCALSVQKFSSNVIEKCIRVAEHSTRKMLIEELLNRTRLEKLLRDSFGNYCVQTALDYAEPNQRAILVEGIRPILPLIRNTPYGKRIQSKLQREQMEMASTNGIAQYSSYPNQQQQQALMNIALVNQGLGAAAGQGLAHNVHALPPGRPMSQGLPHSANQLGDVYNARGSMYGLNQGAAGLHGQQAFHTGQQMPHSLQSHQSIDSYVLQGNNGHSHSLASTPNGFSNVGSFSNGMPAVASFGGSVGLAGNINDPYQRASYGYGM